MGHVTLTTLVFGVVLSAASQLVT